MAMSRDIASRLPSRGLAARIDLPRWREVLFVAILLACWITTKPFGALPPGDIPSGAPDLANQLVFASLAVAALTALFLTDLRLLRPLAQPSYALLLIWLFVGATISADPLDSLRALAFTLIAMLLAATLYALPDDIARFRALLVLGAAAVLAFAWIGVFTVPDAVHSDDDPFEPEHAGSWRGHLTHKNIAGAMMGVLAIVGVYALRSGQRLLGAGLLVGAVIFPLVHQVEDLVRPPALRHHGRLPRRMAAQSNPALRAADRSCRVPQSPHIGFGARSDDPRLQPAFLKDPSFTGRFDIWRFGFEKLADRPWTGFGFEAFWLSDMVKRSESKLELAWNPQNIVHGHNGYLDVALALGIPGLIVTVWVFVLKPVLDFHRCRDRGLEVARLAGMCIMLWLFISLGMCLEVFYFRRADPIWFALLIAVFGLRFLAALPVRTPPRP